MLPLLISKIKYDESFFYALANFAHILCLLIGQDERIARLTNEISVLNQSADDIEFV